MDVAQSKNERAAVFKTRALGGGNKLFAVAREVGSVPSAMKKLVTEPLGMVNLHDNILHERRRSAVDNIDHESIASWDRTQRAAISTIIADSTANVQKARAATKAKRDKILSPPPLAANDFTTALRENETRTQMRTLNAEQQGRVMKTLSQDRDLLLALARSPAPLDPLAEAARGVYKGLQQKAEAEALKGIDDEDEGHDWAETSLAALSRLIAGG